MKEADRLSRNAQRLTELHPIFANRVQSIIHALEGRNFRPRIQDAYRTPADQLNAFNSGHSKLKFGFHNVTGANGRPEGLAVDLLDDDFPLASRPSYLLHLASVAEPLRCVTGIRWGLTKAAMRGAIDTAILQGDWDAPVKLGWDPTHIEPGDVTMADVAAGRRPR